MPEINRLLCSVPPISINMHAGYSTPVHPPSTYTLCVKYTKIHHCQMDFCMPSVNSLIHIYQERGTVLLLLMLTITPRSTTWTHNLCPFICEKLIRQYSHTPLNFSLLWHSYIKLGVLVRPHSLEGDPKGRIKPCFCSWLLLNVKSINLQFLSSSLFSSDLWLQLKC